MNPILRRAVAAGAIAAGACDPPPMPSSATVIGSTLDGDHDRVAPTASLGVMFSAAVDPQTVDETDVFLVRGIADGAFVSDAEHPPLSADRLAKLAPIKISVDGATLHLVPRRALAEHALHTLVVTRRVNAGGGRLAKAYVAAFTTGAEDLGAPVLELVDPMEEADDVARNLRTVTVRFTRPVEDVDATSLRLLGPGGHAVAAIVEPDDVANQWRIVPDAPLAAGRHLVVASAPIVDDAGEPPFDSQPRPGFTIGNELRTEAPRIDGLDVVPGSGCLVARFTTDEASRGILCVDGDCASEPTATERHELVRPLAAGGSATFRLEVRDETTAPSATVGPLDAPASSPRQLTITEVLSRPATGDPSQQFVELLNRGTDEASLDGLVLATATAVDVLPPLTVPPGGRALVVPNGWVPDDGMDPAPAPGTVIAPVAGARLAHHGLHVGGDAIALLESDGRPVSHFSTVGLLLARGQSARRTLPCDVDEAYQGTPNGTSTPGAP